jgi:AmiR/NasT family two-component response regulator
VASDHREEVSNTPAESLKPGRTGPPKVEAKPQPILLCVPDRAVAVRLAAASIYDWLVAPLGNGTDHLRVLIANERKDRLELVIPIVAALGHEVIAREIEVEDVGAVTARERPDVALVGLGASSLHALDLIDKIVREAACPVIALLHEPDPGFVKEASKRGVFAHISDDDVEDWQSSIDIVLRRFAEYQDLEGAFGRRAQIERAKGILMERHSIDETHAFEMLRERSRIDNRKLIDLATAVVDGHRLLPKQPAGPVSS